MAINPCDVTSQFYKNSRAEFQIAQGEFTYEQLKSVDSVSTFHEEVQLTFEVSRAELAPSEMRRHNQFVVDGKFVTFPCW